MRPRSSPKYCSRPSSPLLTACVRQLPLSARATPASSIRSSSATPAPYAADSAIDIQGINWSRTRLGRHAYRLERMRRFAQLEMLREPPIYIGNDMRRPAELGELGLPALYEPFYMNRSYACTVQHYQLRHLLACPSSRSIFFTYGCRLLEWDPISRAETLRMNMRDYCGADCKISTLCATTDVVVLGGYYGEVVVQRTYRHSRFRTLFDRDEAIVRRVTNSDNGITNHISAIPATNGRQFMLSSNDGYQRILDLEANKITVFCYREQAAINAAKGSPCGRLMCFGADSNDVEIVDMRTGKTAMHLEGHIGYTFSCDWSPSGNLVATGNEDHTARVFDIRRLPPLDSASLFVLPCRLAACRSVAFSPDGLVLGCMEETDFITFYDVVADCTRCSTVDFFGETAGFAYTPDGRYAYVGCGDADRGGIIEMRRPPMTTLFRLEALLL